MSGKLVVPDESDFLSAVGVEPETGDEGEGVFGVRIEGLSIHRDVFDITWSLIEDSVKISWSREGAGIVDIYREGATNLQIHEEAGETRLVAIFASHDSGIRSEISVRVTPDGHVSDRLLFV